MIQRGLNWDGFLFYNGREYGASYYDRQHGRRRKGRGGSGYVVKKIVRFLKSGFLVISIGFRWGFRDVKGIQKNQYLLNLLKLSVRKEWMTIL